MKVNINFTLPDSCQVYLDENGILLVVTLTIKATDVDHYLLKDNDSFISKKRGYIQSSRLIGYSDCNMQSMYSHYRSLLEELMILARKIKISKLDNEIIEIENGYKH